LGWEQNRLICYLTTIEARLGKIKMGDREIGRFMSVKLRHLTHQQRELLPIYGSELPITYLWLKFIDTVNHIGT
jgi:hypothetical protein